MQRDLRFSTWNGIQLSCSPLSSLERSSNLTYGSHVSKDVSQVTMAVLKTSLVLLTIVTSSAVSSRQQWSEEQFEAFENGLSQLADKFLPFEDDEVFEDSDIQRDGEASKLTSIQFQHH